MRVTGWFTALLVLLPTDVGTGARPSQQVLWQGYNAAGAPACRPFRFGD